MKLLLLLVILFASPLIRAEEKIVIIEKQYDGVYLHDVNELLKQGWTVKLVTCAASNSNGVTVVFVLEKK